MSSRDVSDSLAEFLESVSVRFGKEMVGVCVLQMNSLL